TDSVYHEGELILQPTTAQPQVVHMEYNIAFKKALVNVRPITGLPYAMYVDGLRTFRMYGVEIRPDPMGTWTCGVLAKVRNIGDTLDIRGGGVVGTTTQNGYTVDARVGSYVSVWVCVVQVTSQGIVVVWYQVVPMKSVEDQTFATGGGTLDLRDNTITGGDTAVSVSGEGQYLYMQNNVFTGMEVGTAINSMGENAEIRILGGADTTMTSSIYFPNGHNVSVFEVGSSTLNNSMLARRASGSMLKFASATSAQSTFSNNTQICYDLTFNNDPGVTTNVSISHTDIDWTKKGISIQGDFGGSATINDVSIQLTGNPADEDEIGVYVKDKYSGTQSFDTDMFMLTVFGNRGVVIDSLSTSSTVSIPDFDITAGTNGILVTGSPNSVQIGNPVSGSFKSGTSSPIKGRVGEGLLTRRNMYSMQKLANTKSGAFSLSSSFPFTGIELNLSGDSTNLTINGVTMDWIGNGVKVVQGDANCTLVATGLVSHVISNNTIDLNGSGGIGLLVVVVPRTSLAARIKSMRVANNTVQNASIGLDVLLDNETLCGILPDSLLFSLIDVSDNIFSNSDGVAIPNFVAMQYRAKRAEVMPNTDGIKIQRNTLVGGGPFSTPFLIDGNLTFNSVQFDSNTISDFAIMHIQLKSKRAERPDLVNKVRIGGNTITDVGDVSIEIDMDSESASPLDVDISNNTFDGGTIAANNFGSNSVMARGAKYELNVRRGGRATLAGTMQTQSITGSASLTFSNNTLTNFADGKFDIDDSSGTLTTQISDNTFTGTAALASNQQTLMGGNKYEVSVRRGQRLSLVTIGFKTSSVVEGEWFTYENNTVTGFSDGALIDLTNEGDAGTARLEGNTFSNATVASNDLKAREASMATNRYELQFRRSSRFNLVSAKQQYSLTTGDSLIVRNNTFTELDGGGLFINAVNDVVGEPMNVWLDGNTLSSNSTPGILSLYESEFDSGDVNFNVTGNQTRRIKAEMYCEKIEFYYKAPWSFASNSSLLSHNPPNTFTGGYGVAFYRNPSTPITFNYQNVIGNTLNILNATNGQIDARYCWWGTTDSAEIASKMEGDVLFMPFLTDSVETQLGGIAGVVYEDANFNYTRDSETGLEGWTVNLLVDGSIVDSRVTDANGAYYFQNIPFDQYTVCLVPQDDYAYSENLNCASIDFLTGTSFTVNFGVFNDSKKFRTFSADTLLSKKPVKIVFKSNVRTSLYPNTASAVENVFTRLGKNGATFLGNAQSDKNRAKLLAWISYKKAADLGKFYTSAHTGTSYPIDSLRPVGKTAKKLKGPVKADKKQFNNRFWEQGIAFNLNIISSAVGITPTGFGELVFDTPYSLLGKKVYGKTLTEIAEWMNQLMTDWDSLGVENSSAYAELSDFAMNVLKPLNEGFSATVDSSNSQIDTMQVTTGIPGLAGGKKNPYAVRLLGVKTASEVGLVKYVPGTVPTVKIQDEGFDEDESTLPTTTALMQNYPNPFNPSTNFGFRIADFGLTTLKVYDMLGREVATLLNNEGLEQGEYEINFDASSLTSGVYFYRLTVNGVDDASQSFTDVKRMLLVK
ncbi:MAG: T9SS type A sorting domain-containing protein, partial [Ignavibacteriae bacterium]|nr:T9SS type A sorting domain-containing protein [Ignavibacteriota bacterium]